MGAVHLCVRTGSQGIVKVRPEEFLRHKQTKICLCERFDMKNGTCSKFTQLSPKSFQEETELSIVELLGVKRMGQVGFP